MIIEYFDDLYPDSLRQLKKPPTRLYAKGNIELLSNYGIAVVGSRSNTQYGENMCKMFTKRLVEYNLTIISGLAIGIDSIAHKTCLKNSGKTIAVLPSGLDNIYPKINENLAKEILDNNGLLISEYEDGTEADSNKFRERNRIVAGIGIGTLVIEAGEKSGTRITARETILQGKPVFSVPSNLDNIKGKTNNYLIKNGCNIVTNVEDIINFYEDIEFVKKETISKDIFSDVSDEFIDVYKVIGNSPIGVNEISKKLKLPISDINYKIMMLEMEDKIQELPGQLFVRKRDD